MTIRKIAVYIALLVCYACHTTGKENPEFILPEPSLLEKILETGTLNISTFYNTTDYYVYQGITRGFHYDLAKDFARYLGVKLQIIEVNHDADTAMQHLREGKFDLLAISLTQTPERNRKIRFSQPIFHTEEVLVQHKAQKKLEDISELHGKEIFIPKSSTYKEVLQQIQDSLNIQIYITEIDQCSYEDMLHWVETGKIHYMVIDKNIAKASGLTMKNLTPSLSLKENISISWATHPDAVLLTQEIDTWLKQIRKSGKLNYLYHRYFNNHQSVSHQTSKYALLKKGIISPYDSLLKKESKRLNWDWRLLAALVFSESQFNPEAESEVGAYGLMQIIPETAEQYNVSDYFRPDSNVYAGVEYLRYLDRFFAAQNIDSTERVKFTLAAYNAGAGHVLDAMRLAEKYGKNPHIWTENVDFYIRHKNKPEYYRDTLAKNGYCNGPQTYHYVNRVLEVYSDYKNMK